MELFLNLVWISLVALALFRFSRGRSVSGQLARAPYRNSLIALACVMVLLFPIVSASDDLHPTQAVVEEASKRVQLAVAPLHLLQTSPPPSLLPAALTLFLMSSLVVLQRLHPSALKARLLDGPAVSSAGRAPPSL
jgi:hypothetical protein